MLRGIIRKIFTILANNLSITTYEEIIILKFYFKFKNIL